MYKSINLYKNTDEHDFDSLKDALDFFRRQWPRVKVVNKTSVVNGLTHGEKTTVKDRIMIGLWRDVHPTNEIDFDAPDEVIMLENQTPRDYPLA